MCKYFNHYVPDNFYKYFFLNLDVHSHYTRSSNLRHLFSHNKLCSFNVSITGPQLLNTLPSQIKSCLTLSSFKLKLDKVLLHQQLTNI